MKYCEKNIKHIMAHLFYESFFQWSSIQAVLLYISQINWNGVANGFEKVETNLKGGEIALTVN